MILHCGLHREVSASRTRGCPIPSRTSGKGGALGLVSMPKNLERRHGQKDLHFITCSCYRRLPLFPSVPTWNLFVRILDEVREQYGFAVVGYVIMPEHVHLLISEPRKGTPSTVMQVLKQRVSREARRRRRRTVPQAQLRFNFGESAGERLAALPQFWQRRFHDFNVWSAKKRSEKLEYMHMNPVKREFVVRPEDWAWSSCAAYSGKSHGRLPIDFL
jgi:putative transposase